MITKEMLAPILEEEGSKIKQHYKAEFEKIDAQIKDLFKQHGEYKEAGVATDDIVAKIKEKTDKQTDVLGEMQKHLDILDQQMQKGIVGLNSGKGFSALLGDAIAEKADIFKNRKLDSTIKLDEALVINKAVGDMSSASNLADNTTPAFYNPYMVPGVMQEPQETIRVRNFLPTGTTSSPIIHYVQYVGHEGGPSTVAEGGLKPQVDFDFSKEEESVKKIAETLTIPEEMLDDIDWMQSFITAQAIYLLDLEENDQLLNGSGSGTNITGLLTVAPTLDGTKLTATGLANKTTKAQFGTVLNAAYTYLRKLRYAASAIMVNPTDYYVLEESKDDAGQYVKADAITGQLRIRSIPIVEFEEVPVGTFLMGDMRRSSMLFDRKQTNVRFYDQHANNAIYNLITVVIEKRLALIHPHPNALIKGNFATLLPLLDSGVADA